MKLFVRNISYNCTEDTLRELFEQVGEVASVKIVTDRFTGRSKGFGFVEMANNEDGQKAIDEINEKDVDGRPIYVDVARERPAGDRPSRR